MLSPAQMALQRYYAQQSRSADDLATTNAYEMMLVKLNNDRAQLKKIESKESKIALKRKLIPDYIEWINGVLTSNNSQQDDVFMRILVWMIDTKQFEQAFPLAEHAIKHNWVTPDEYKRKTATLITEELANTVLADISNKQPVDTGVLFKFADLVADKDMFDEVRAKLNKAIGYALKETDPEKALSYLTRALELDENSGVKTVIKELEKALNKTDS